MHNYKKYIYSVTLIIGLMFSACAKHQENSKKISVESSKVSLTNTHWRLTVVGTKPVIYTKNNPREAYIILSKGRLKGNSGCNSMGGTYELKADKLSLIRPMIMSRMFCKNSVEKEFVTALIRMTKYKIIGTYLDIFDNADIRLARFELLHL